MGWWCEDAVGLYYVYFSLACCAALSNPALQSFTAFVDFCLNVFTSLNPSHVRSCSACAGFPVALHFTLRRDVNSSQTSVSVWSLHPSFVLSSRVCRLQYVFGLQSSWVQCVVCSCYMRTVVSCACSSLLAVDIIIKWLGGGLRKLTPCLTAIFCLQNK